MKKNQKEKNAKGKDSHSIRDIIPSSYQHIREPKTINFPNNTEKIFSPENIPNPLFEEFPSDETDLETLQAPLLQNPEEIFIDPDSDKIYLPRSLYKDFLFEEIKWSRPIHYILENKLDLEIKKHYQKKNTYNFREKVHEKFREEERRKKMEEEGILEPKSDKSDSDYNEKNDGNALYKDYFNLLRTKPNITIVKFIERQETDEEYEIRIKKEEEEIERFKNEKKKNKNLQPTITEVNTEKLKLNEASPSCINMKDGYPLYCRWLASIFEIIRERNITDVNNHYSIFKRIYPQENGVPVYNPKGIYWIKLYHFGKLRKIEIDDRMPTDKYDKFYLPHCDNLDEIWPAILTKALLKLYAYKIVSSSFKECGDYEIIYALTGYIPEFVDLIKENNLCKMFEVIDKNIEENKYEPDSKVIEEMKNESKMENSNFSQINNTNQNGTKVNINSENPIPEEEEMDDPKFIFLQKALSDENYINNNCFLFCYRHAIEPVIIRDDDDDDEELPVQKLYDPSKRKLFSRMNSMKSSKQNEVTIQTKKNKRISIKMDKVEEIEETPKEGGGSRRSSLRFKTINPNNKIDVEVKKKLETQKNNTTEEKNEEENAVQIPTQENLPHFPHFVNNNERILNKSRSSRVHFVVQTPLPEKAIELYKEKIFVGVIYDIIEFFNNNCFNMSRLLPIDFSDLRAMIKAFTSNNVFKQLSKEEKKAYIHELREIKRKQKEEKNKRIESLKAKGKKYCCIKIHNSSVAEPNFFRLHNDEEIEMTKKCILNNWNFPPLEYLEHVYESIHNNNEKNDDYEHEDDEVQTHKKKKHYTWSKDVYMHLIENNTQQYKEPKETLIRKEGTWIEPNDFFECFDSFIILYNPKMYQTNFYWDNLWYNTNDILCVNPQNKVLHLSPNENTKKSYMVMNFAVNSDNTFKLRDIAYSIHFLLMRKDDKLEDAKAINFQNYFGSKHIDQLNIKEHYFLIFIGGLFPNGFYMKFFTDFIIEPLKYSDYLSEFKGYTKHSYNIEQPNLTKNEFFVLLRISVKLETKTKFFVINNSTKDNLFKEYIELFVCETGNKNKKKKFFFENIFELEPNEYYFVISCIPPYNVGEDNYDIEILSFPEDDKLDVSQTNTAVPGEVNKSQANIEQIEHISPYDISDNYKHNKHFIVFKEYIFSGETVYATLNIKLRKLQKKEDFSEDVSENESIDKKQKRGSTVNINNNQNELEEVEFDQPIRLKLILFDKEDNTIYETDFYNSITLHNLILEGNISNEVKSNKKNEKEEIPINKPYKIYCFLDKTELPKSFLTQENLKTIYWNIRVYSSNTLGFCEDTHKEDAERKVIEAWEKNEPGRSENAKNSRKRYLLSKKKNIELNEEEKQFLKTQRIRKKTKKAESVDFSQMKKFNKLDNKNKNVKNKIDEINEEEKKIYPELNLNKKTSPIEEHSSIFIKTFLNYAYDKRLKTHDNFFSPEHKQLNTESTAFEKEERITKYFEDNEKLLTENQEDFEMRKTQYIELNKKLFDTILNNRKKSEKTREEVLKGRDDVKSILLLKAEAEEKLKNLIDIILDDDIKDDKNKKKEKNFDFNSAYEIYKEALKTELKSPLVQKVFDLLSQKKEDMIKEELKKVQGKEKEIARKFLEDIRNNHWNISDQLLDKLDSFAN